MFVFVYLAVSGLSYGMLDLYCIMRDLSLRREDLGALHHVGSSSSTRDGTHVPPTARQILGHQGSPLAEEF